MFTNICRNVSLALLFLSAGAIVVSSIIITTVRAQQSGQIPTTESNSSTSNQKSVLATNSNNYAASIASLTTGTGKPGQYQNNLSHKQSDKYIGILKFYFLLLIIPKKQTKQNEKLILNKLHIEKLQSSSSSYNPSAFGLFSNYQKPFSAYFNYADKHVSL